VGVGPCDALKGAPPLRPAARLLYANPSPARRGSDVKLVAKAAGLRGQPPGKGGDKVTAMATNWLGGILKGASDPMELLADLARNKTSVRIEVEGTLIKFNSQIMLRKGTVVVGKPVGLKEGLSAGSYVRLRRPSGPRRELRLKVQTPHFNLTSGNAVFICEAPEAEVAARRESERFDVARYNNLRLVQGSEEFRLADVSSRGFKVLTGGRQAQQHFPLGRELQAAHIMLGANARVDLQRVVPRSHHGAYVGCEFTVSREGASERYLNHLLSSLTKAESQRFSATL
jgi:hypothetical protein